MTGDPFDDPDWLAYAEHAREDLVPKLRDSAITISLVPEGETDIKFALELGLSVMMDKPIIAVIPPGTKVPSRLLRVADEIVEGNMDDPDFEARLMQAVRRVIGE